MAPAVPLWAGRKTGAFGRAVKARLGKVDCPERRQAFGNRARETVSRLVARQVVRVEVRDRYGRIVRRVFVMEHVQPKPPTLPRIYSQR